MRAVAACVALLLFVQVTHTIHCPWYVDVTEEGGCETRTYTTRAVRYNEDLVLNSFFQSEEMIDFTSTAGTCTGTGVSQSGSQVRFSPTESGSTSFDCQPTICTDYSYRPCMISVVPESTPESLLFDDTQYSGNEYYPGLAIEDSGSRILVGRAYEADGQTAKGISPGDLLLVIQIQGAEYVAVEGSWGDGDEDNTGTLPEFFAGVYEFAIAADAEEGQILLDSPLVNEYKTKDQQQDDDIISGPFRFQVIKVVRATKDITVAGSAVVQGLPWSPGIGAGGVVVFDVDSLSDGQFILDGVIEMSGRGFQGGYGTSEGTLVSYPGEGITTLPQQTNTKQTRIFTPGSEWPEPNSPRICSVSSGNAGGCGCDDAGGGGGSTKTANGGSGVEGKSSAAGLGAEAIDLKSGTTRNYLGGGGGSGGALEIGKNSAVQSGQAGGGIVIIRAASITGKGTIRANGDHAPNSCSGEPCVTTGAPAGGGGGGGNILLFATKDIAGIALEAHGGNGGWVPEGPGRPGGGGGGGSIWVFSQSPSLEINPNSVIGGSGGRDANSILAEDGDPGEILVVPQCCDITVTQPILVCDTNQYATTSSCLPCTSACSECNQAGTTYDPSTGPCLVCDLLDLFAFQCIESCSNGQLQNATVSPNVCEFQLFVPVEKDISVAGASAVRVQRSGAGPSTHEVEVTFIVEDLITVWASPDANGDWSVESDIRSIYMASANTIQVHVRVTSLSGATPYQSYNLAIPLEVAITTPISDDNLVGANEVVTIQGTSTKRSVLLSLVDKDDRTSVYPVTTDSETGEWEQQLTIDPNFADGAITVRAEVEDSSSTMSDVQYFNYDATAPTLQIDEPADGSYSSGTALTVEGTTDLESDVLLTVGNLGPISIPVTGGVFSVEVSIDTFPEGPFDVNVVATDAAGNTHQETHTVIKDSRLPTLSLIRPTNESYISQINVGALEISGSSTNLTEGTQVEISIEGENLGSVSIDAAGNFLLSVDTSSVADGNVTLSLFAEAYPGNNVTRTRLLQKDTLPPPLAVSDPVNGDYVNLENVNRFPLEGTTENQSQLTITSGDISPLVYFGVTPSFYTLLNLTEVEEGPFDLTVESQDAAGNNQIITTSLIKDTIPPEVEITYPTESQVLNIQEVNPLSIQGFSETGTVRLFLTDGVSNITTGATGYTWQTNENLLTFLDGPVSIIVADEDPAGNVMNQTVNVVLDLTAPSLSLSSPVNESIIADGQLTLEGTIDDSNISVITVQIGNAAPKDIPVSSPFSVIEDISSLPSGYLSVNITVTDEAGNEDTVSIVVDKQSPVTAVGILSPADGELFGNFSGQSVTLQGTANDTSVSIFLTGTTGTQASLSAVTTDDLWESNIDLIGLGFVNENITILVNDSLSSMDSVTIQLDLLPPTLDLVTPSIGYYINIANSTSLRVSGTVDLPDGETVTVRMNATTLPTAIVDQGAFTKVYSPGSFPSGPLLLTIQAVDEAGNVAEQTRVITKDVTPPVIVITNPMDGAVSSLSSITLMGTVTDNQGVAPLVTLQLPDQTSPGLNETIYVNHTAGVWIYEASWSYDGEIHVEASVTDLAGNTAMTSLSIVIDTTPPNVTILGPTETINQYQQGNVLVYGTTEPNSTVVLYINGLLILASGVPDGTFGFYVNITDIPDGDVLFAIHSFDPVGNEGAAAIVVTKDTTPPTLVITNVPTVVNRVQADAVVIAGTSDAGEGEIVRLILAEAAAPTTAISNSTWRFDLNLTSIGVFDGMVSYSITTEDPSGNDNQVMGAFTLDTVPPTVTLFQPLPNALIGSASSASVVVRGNVSDPINTLTVEAFDPRLNQARTRAFPDNQTSFTDTMDLSIFSDGVIELTVTVRDAAGNQNQIYRNVTLDTLDPYISLISPTNGSYLNMAQNSITVYGETNMLNVTLWVSGLDLFNLSAPSGNFSQTIDISSYPDGSEITIMAWTSDAAGNVNTSTVHVTRDISVVAPYLYRPTPGRSNLIGATEAASYLIYGSSQETQVQLSSLDDSFNETISTNATGGFEYLLDVSGFPDGVWTLVASNTDPAGNMATVMANVTIDQEPPALTLLTPSPGQRIESSNETAVLVTALTDASSVSNGLYINNQFWGLVRLKNNTIQELVDVTGYVEGNLTITVSVTDLAGNRREDSVVLYKDTAPVGVHILSPQNGTVSPTDTLSVSGTTNATLVHLYLRGNGHEVNTTVNVSPNGSWITLVDWMHEDGWIEVEAISGETGNPSSDSIWVLIDTILPVITIEEPLDGTLLNATDIPNVLLRGFIDDTRATDVVITVSEMPVSYPLENNTFHITMDLSGFPDGNIPIDVSLYEESGAVQRRVTVVKDTTPPTVSITYPPAFLPLDSQGLANLNVTITSSEAASLILMYTDHMGLSTSTAQEAPAGTSILNALLPGASFSEGLVNITIQALDEAGNIGEVSRLILLDNAGPTIQLNRPIPDQWLNQGSETLLVEGQVELPDGSTVDLVLEEANAVVARAPRKELTLTVQEQRFYELVDVTDLSDGNLRLILTAEDAAGNRDQHTVDLRKDTIAPTGTLSSVTEDNIINLEEMSDFLIHGTGEPMSFVHLTVTPPRSQERSEWTLKVNAESEWSVPFSFSTTQDGLLEISMFVRDEAGNDSPPMARSVFIDATRPRISINMVAGDDRVTPSEEANVEISGTAQVTDGSDVTVVIRSGVMEVLRTTAMVQGNFWSTTVSLVDAPTGELVIDASVFNSNGNLGSAQRVITKENDIPPSSSPSPTITHSNTASLSFRASPSSTSSPSHSWSATASLSVGASPSSTNTASSTPTRTPSPSPTISWSSSASFIQLVHPDPEQPSLSSTRTATATRSRAPSNAPSATPLASGADSRSTDVEISLPPNASTEDTTIDFSFPGDDRPVGSLLIPAAAVPPHVGDVSVRITIAQDTVNKKGFAGDITVDITITDASGAAITQFDDPLEICLSPSGLPANREDDECLGYYDEERNRWVCEDSCPKKDESNNRCGKTGGSRGNKNPCGDDDTAYVLAWVSLGLIVAAIVAVCISVVLIEIRVRYVVRRQSQAFDAMSRRAAAVEAR